MTYKLYNCYEFMKADKADVVNLGPNCLRKWIQNYIGLMNYWENVMNFYTNVMSMKYSTHSTVVLIV